MNPRDNDRSAAIPQAEGRPGDRDGDTWAETERETGGAPVDGPVEANTGDVGPDDTVETIAETPDPLIVPPTRPAPDGIESAG